MNSGLRLQLSEEGADAERLDALTGFLRRELLQLDVEDVTVLRAGDPAPGTRAFDMAAVGGWAWATVPTACARSSPRSGAGSRVAGEPAAGCA